MTGDEQHVHVLVRVEAGHDTREELAVAMLSGGVYRLVVPPALTLGLAVGDVFEIDAETSRPRVVERSGNLTVWLFPAGAEAGGSGVADEVEALGGTFEGVASSTVLIFTLPVAATFPAIEAVFEGFVARFPGSQWMFGNAYADDGQTPLGWWDT